MVIVLLGCSLSAQRHAGLQVPFETSNNVVLLRVSVNGSAQLRFILDTGASGTVISERAARRLGLRSREPSETTTQGGVVRSASLENSSVSIGRVKLANIELTALSLDGLEAGFGTRIDGILGYEVFERYVVEIDYPRRVIHFYEPGTFRYSGDGEVLPVTFVDQTPFVDVEIDGGRGPVKASLLLDIGNVSTTNLYPAFVEKHGLFGAGAKAVNITFGALISGLAGRVGRLEEMRMGEIAVKQPFVTLPAKAGGDAYNDGLIGGEILRRFRIVIDYSRKRVILEPNSALSEPFDFDASGISLSAGGPDLTTYRIRSLMENSPAVEAGLRVGDVITAINGRNVRAMPLEQIRKMFRRAGARYVLDIRRDKVSHRVSLVTRSLI